MPVDRLQSEIKLKHKVMIMKTETNKTRPGAPRPYLGNSVEIQKRAG